MTRRAGAIVLAGLHVLLLAVWLGWGLLVVPDAIGRAYRGDGSALVERVLQAQGPRPLADFLEFWRRSVWALAALWLGAGAVSEKGKLLPVRRSRMPSASATPARGIAE